MFRALPLVLLLTLFHNGLQDATAEAALRLGVFNVDVSPPIGSPVAYVDAKEIVDPLSARGVVLLSGERPIVLCAVDFIGIGNEGQDAWKRPWRKRRAPRQTMFRSMHSTSMTAPDAI